MIHGPCKGNKDSLHEGWLPKTPTYVKGTRPILMITQRYHRPEHNHGEIPVNKFSDAEISQSKPKNTMYVIES
jgi:hypothetical protein